MSTFTRDGIHTLRSTVMVAENLCSLPAIATQDWCDRAAAAFLPIVGSGVAVSMIALIDDRGVIQRQEATGVGGCSIAHITTTVGRASSAAPSVIPIDPNDANLVRVRTSLAQSRELSWTPGHLSSGQVRVGSPSLLCPTPPAHAALTRRWDAFSHAPLLLGAVMLGTGIAARTLIVEIAPTGPDARAGEHELALLEAALPLLARRATLAIGTDTSEHAAWLTHREQIVLQHLLLGKSVREIADELGRSPHTVHDHVKSLHRKLKASSRGELVARALGHVELKPLSLPLHDESESRSVQTN